MESGKLVCFFQSAICFSHRFAGAAGSEWYIYDVGGSRSSVSRSIAGQKHLLNYFPQRPSWIPFFDDVQAIIFLAPLAFNLMLEEDSRVNRLVSLLDCCV